MKGQSVLSIIMQFKSNQATHTHTHSTKLKLGIITIWLTIKLKEWNCIPDVLDIQM